MSVLFVTGAGISANAGIPTYRENGSSWRDPDLEKKSHSTRYGNHLDELWNKMWGPMSLNMDASRPTHAHYVMADFGGIIATQNIDTLHEQAGSEDVNHLHGKMTIRCMRCKKTDLDVMWLGVGAPFCPHCNSKKTRPDAVLFGESLPAKMMKRLYAEAGKAEKIIAVGTSLNVYPAADLILQNMGKSILINKEAVPASKFIKFYQGDADEVLPQVLDSL